MVRETQDPFVFCPFNSLHHSSPTFFPCVWRRWRLWQRCSQVCFCVLSPVTCYVVYQAGRVLRVCCDSISYLMPYALPYAYKAASQFYTRRTVDIPYSCHTTLIPLGKASVLLLLAFFSTMLQKAEKVWFFALIVSVKYHLLNNIFWQINILHHILWHWAAWKHSIWSIFARLYTKLYRTRGLASK